MSLEERHELLESERVVVVSSNGPRGWPHSMPLWYVPRQGATWIYTYAKSQKVRNFERDRRATLVVETGTAYDELCGLMIAAEAVIERDPSTVLELAKDLAVRYGGADRAELELDGKGAAALQRQARKRVAVRFVERRVGSWDHGKLGGEH